MAVRVTVYGTADMRQIDKARDSLNRLAAEAKIASGGIQGQMLRLSGAMQNAGAKITATGTALTRNLTVPLLAAGYGIMKATEAAAEDAKAQTILATTLRNTAGATDATIASTENWITAQQKALGVTDDQLRPALGILAGATGDVTKAQQLAALALDISAARGIDAETASKALAKAYTGNFGALSRLVPGIDAAAMASGDFTEVQKALADMVGGTASAAAETQAGKMQIAKVAFQEATETLGYAFMPIMEQVTDLIVTKVVPAVESIAAWFGKLSPQMRTAIVVAAGIAAALGPVLAVVGSMTSGIGALLGVLGKMPVAWLTALGPIGLIVGAIGLLLATSPELRAMLGNFLQTALKALAPLWKTIQEAMKPVIAAIGQLVRTVLPPLIKAFATILPPIIQVLTNVIKAMVPVIAVVIKIAAQLILIVIKIATTIASVVGTVLTFAAKLAAGMAKWIGGVISWFAKLASKILTALGNAGSWLVNIGKQIVDGLLQGLKNAWTNVTSWLGNVAGGLVDKVKDVLGIQSPSTVFAGIGRNIGQGLEMGLRGTSDLVGAAARSLAETASVSASVTANMGVGSDTAAVAPASAGSGSGSVTIAPGAVQIVINGNADAGNVGGAVEDALGRLLRELRSR
jgi:phage-related protein